MTVTATSGVAASKASAHAQATAFANTLAPLRRLSAVIRLAVALVCAVLVLADPRPASPYALAALFCYLLWCAYLMASRDVSGPPGRALWHSAADVFWTLLMWHVPGEVNPLIAIALLQPIVVACIGPDARRGMLLAAVAAMGVLIERDHAIEGLHISEHHGLLALGLLALGPCAALCAQPMTRVRQRLVLIGDISATIDPRRGVEVVAGRLLEALRACTGAPVAALVLPAAEDAPAMVSSTEEGSFRMGAKVHERLESLLGELPACPVIYVKHRPRWLSAVRFCGPDRPAAQTEANLAEVAALLGVTALAIVPLLRYQQRHGNLILGHVDERPRMSDVLAVFDAAPELSQRIELAAIVDQLQEESAAHERERIGRDLHDSAVQPYLGLKFAVEAAALRIPPGNPARREVDALTALVNAEVGELREFISGLRSGEPMGDNALLPAVRRQVTRFSRLFNMKVTLDVPPELVTSRRVASDLCHLVNEALNNVRRHAPARHVQITLTESNGTIELRVRDDAATVTGQVLPEFTPLSLSERVAELGGSLRVDRIGGLDTEVVIDIPLRSHDAAPAADLSTPNSVCTAC